MGRGRPKGPEKQAYPLRLDPHLLDAIKHLASAELRSANAQMEILLQEALSKRGIRLRDSADEDFD